MATRGGSSRGQGSAGQLALPLLLAVQLGCGNEGEGKPWVGVQECTVGIPPEDTSVPEAIPRVSIPLTGVKFYQTGTGFYLQNFTIGPIAGFYCETSPYQFQLTVRYTSGNPVVLGVAGSSGLSAASTSNASSRPPLQRPVVMDPFQCRASDGRTYVLSGTGAADLQSMFIDMRFSAWLPEGQATLLCTTRYLQVTSVPDAGVAPETPAFAPPAGEGAGTPPVEEGVPPESTAGSGMAGAGATEPTGANP